MIGKSFNCVKVKSEKFLRWKLHIPWRLFRENWKISNAEEISKFYNIIINQINIKKYVLIQVKHNLCNFQKSSCKSSKFNEGYFM